MSRHAMLKRTRRPLALTVLTLALGAILATGVGAQDFPLFVTDYSFGIGVYSLDASGTLTPRGFVPGLLSSVRNDGDGNLYTCSQDSPDVSKIDTAGNVSVYATGFTSCFGLLFAQDGTLYVSDVNAGRIETVPAGGGSFTTLASGLDFPMHMTFDTDGSILVTEFYGGRVARVDGGGSVSSLAAVLDHPVGVAVGPDDNIYVSEMFTGRLMRIDRAGQASLLAVPGHAPAGLDFHRDGRLFVAELSGGAIVTVDIGTGVVTSFRDGLASPAGLSFRRQFAPAVMTVSVDLKPGSDTNPLNLTSNGVVPVAVLSSADFDASRIDADTVRFGVTGTEAAPAHGGHLEDVNGDGALDMVFDFPNGALGIPLTSPGNSLVPLKLTGKTLDGQAFEGEDVARITPNNTL